MTDRIQNTKQYEYLMMTDVVQNTKQYEYLMTIKKIGMKIIFRENLTPEAILEAFGDYEKYFVSPETTLRYYNSLEKIIKKILQETCSPDTLLYEMGQYTPMITYDDESEDKEQTFLYDDDDDWLYS